MLQSSQPGQQVQGVPPRGCRYEGVGNTEQWATWLHTQHVLSPPVHPGVRGLVLIRTFSRHSDGSHVPKWIFIFHMQGLTN